MRVSATPIPRFAGGVPATDMGSPVFAGRFTGTGTRVGTPIHRRYAPMFSTCSKAKKANTNNFMETNCLVLNSPVASYGLGHAVHDRAFCSEAVAHCNRWPPEKPKGLPSQSPGLARGTSAYPGDMFGGNHQPQRGCASAWRGSFDGHFPGLLNLGVRPRAHCEKLQR